MTWMNSIANGRPVVPRTGYVVEINALWYNALKFCAEMAESNKDKKIAAELEARADIAKEAFQKMFITDKRLSLRLCRGRNRGLERSSEYDIPSGIRLFST